MTPVDFALIGIVLILAIVGGVRGLLREVIALLTWIVALWGAWQFGSQLEPHLGGLLDDPAIKPWAARAIVFVGILFVGAAVGWIVGYFVQLSLFRGVDRFLGVLFGVLRGVVVAGVLVILAQTLQLSGSDWWKRSQLMPYAEASANTLRAIVGEDPIGRIEDLVTEAG